MERDIKKRKSLGKGLGSLLGEDDVNSGALMEIDINDIDPNLEQPRRRFDQETLEELADSIKNVGVIQPISVCRTGDRYRIIAGERRWRAARLAGLTKIPALVKDLEKIEIMVVALVENLQRDDLNAADQARAINALMEEFGLTQEQVSKRIGKSRSAVANLLRLLSLDDAILDMVADGTLSEGHARALIALKPEIRLAVAADITKKGLTVRQVEALSKQPEDTRSVTVLDEEKSGDFDMMISAAKKALGARVQVSGRQNKGKITIHYSSYEEFERIYEILSGIEGD